MKKIIKDENGSFALLFGVCLLVLAGIIGAALDYSNAMRLRTQFANANDNALMAAAAEARRVGLMDANGAENVSSTAKIKKLLEERYNEFFAANMSPGIKIPYTATPKFNPENSEFTGNVEFSYDTSILKLLGYDKLDVKLDAAIGVGRTGGEPISMYLVLDRSGSMAARGKMRNLKAAVRDLAKRLKKADPDGRYVRTGAVAYSHHTYDSSPMAWGTSAMLYYVSAMKAGGGTNSSGAVAKASSVLSSKDEGKAHRAKNGSGNVKKIMLFLTDGINNAGADAPTIASCNKMKKENIEIYTIAFSAPAQGQRLLKSCATSNDHFFNAENKKDLLEAFRQIGKQSAKKIAFTK